jgi:hypothetical protein
MRLFNNRPVAGIKQNAGAKIDRLLRAVHDHHLLRIA